MCGGQTKSKRGRERASRRSHSPRARGALRDPIVIHLYRCVDYIALVTRSYALRLRLSLYIRNIPYRSAFASLLRLWLDASPSRPWVGPWSELLLVELVLLSLLVVVLP